MGNKNFFSGIEATEREGSNKGSWFSDGTYLVELSKFMARESSHPDREGQHIAIVEATVLEVHRSTEVSNNPGSKVAWFNVLERNNKGKLTTKGERAMGRIKNFAAAALGGVDDGAITSGVVGGLTEAVPEDSIGEGEALKGIKLLADVVTNTSQKTGKSFTNVTWAAVSE